MVKNASSHAQLIVVISCLKVLHEVTTEDAPALHLEQLLHQEAAKKCAGVPLNRRYRRGAGVFQQVAMSALKRSELQHGHVTQSAELCERPIQPLVTI